MYINSEVYLCNAILVNIFEQFNNNFMDGGFQVRTASASWGFLKFFVLLLCCVTELAVMLSKSLRYVYRVGQKIAQNFYTK